MADSELLLVSDVGGTNTSIAMVRHSAGEFAIEAARRYGSASLSGIEEAFDQFIAADWTSNERPSRCCVSGAGPVVGRVCDMTNVPWKIDADAVQAHLQIPTFVINDFTAISYALPLLDSHTQIRAMPLPHPGGRIPNRSGSVRLAVGAGTGLGVGFLTEDHGHFTAHPSEGGHSEFTPFDDLSEAFRAYVDGRLGPHQGAEQFISGQGITNAFRFFRDTGRLTDDEVTKQICAADDADKPRLISEAAANHDGLAAIMRLFVAGYARFASDAAAFFLPTAGLYLAGGIAAKNHRWFVEDDLFTATFERNYNPRVERVLRDVPVHIIVDYDISLYGAAHAALSLDAAAAPT